MKNIFLSNIKMYILINLILNKNCATCQIGKMAKISLSKKVKGPLRNYPKHKVVPHSSICDTIIDVKKESISSFKRSQISNRQT